LFEARTGYQILANKITHDGKYWHTSKFQSTRWN